MKKNILLVCFFILLACSGPEIKKPKIDVVQFPLLPSISSVRDFDGLSFQGSLLVFDDQIDPNLLSALSEASVKDRVISAKLEVNLRHNLNPTRVKLELLGEEYLDLASKRLIDYSRKEDIDTLLLEWFLKYSKDLDSAATNSEALSLHRYCDAKVWQFASSKSIAESKFTKVPMPSRLCKSYYSQKGILDSESIDCEVQAEGKNYFNCFWRQGVLKTPMYLDSYKNNLNQGSLTENLEEFLTQGTLQSAIAQYSNIFSPSFLKQKKLNSFSRLRLSDDRSLRSMFVPTYGIPTELDGQAITLEQISPMMWIEFFEQANGAKTDILDSFLIRQEDFSNFSKVLYIWSGLPGLDQLNLDHCLLAAAGNACIKTLLQGERGERTVLRLPGFITVEDQESFTEIEQRTKALLLIIKKSEQIQSELLKASLENSVEAAVSATEQGVAKLFFRDGVELSFELLDSQKLRVTFWINDQSLMPLSGCLQPSSGQSVSCSSDTSDSAKVSWNRTTQTIEISTQLVQPTSLGLKEIARAGYGNGVSFSDLATKDLKDKFLALKLGFNRVDEVLNIFSGGLAILDSQKNQIYQGNISLKE